MRFWLGTHEVSWLGRTAVPLFVSRRRLARQKSWARALGPWALDSGGFTELRMNGRWSISESEYVHEVLRWRDAIGGLEWCAPMDWMCEPSIVRRTGLSVFEHQDNTISSFIRLRDQLGSLVVPVLQGWDLHDYLRGVTGLWSRAAAFRGGIPVGGGPGTVAVNATDPDDRGRC